MLSLKVGNLRGIAPAGARPAQRMAGEEAVNAGFKSDVCEKTTYLKMQFSIYRFGK
jgi:hypothetical protein